MKMVFDVHSGMGRNNEDMGRIDALEIMLKEEEEIHLIIELNKCSRRKRGET